MAADPGTTADTGPKAGIGKEEGRCQLTLLAPLLWPFGLASGSALSCEENYLCVANVAFSG